jgi:hypothetical protein
VVAVVRLRECKRWVTWWWVVILCAASLGLGGGGGAGREGEKEDFTICTPEHCCSRLI